MMRSAVFSAVFAASAFIAVPAAAQVEAGDSEWAECIWDRDPAAASSWLAMERPEWRDNMERETEILGFRLYAQCSEAVADVSRPNRIPNWRRLARQLERRRPDSPDLTKAASNSIGFCEYFAQRGDDRILFRIDVVRGAGEDRQIAYQQYFSAIDTDALNIVDEHGRAVAFQFAGAPVADARMRLPQTSMFASPAEGYDEVEVCRTIDPEGALDNG